MCMSTMTPKMNYDVKAHIEREYTRVRYDPCKLTEAAKRSSLKMDVKKIRDFLHRDRP